MATKAVIKYPTAGQESYWKKEENKTSCMITATVGGKDYRLKIFDDFQEWNAAKGAEIEIEIKDEPENGKAGFAYLAGQAHVKKLGNGQPYQRREWKTPTIEKAQEAATFAAELFADVKSKTGANEGAAALITAAIIEKLC